MEEIRIRPDDAGQRLDRFLRKYLRGAKLPTIYKMIRTRQVVVNGKRARPERRLDDGDLVVLYPADRRMKDLRGRPPRAAKAGAPELDVLYEDDDVLAVNKPPFLLVHKGRDEDEATLLDAVWSYLGPSESKTFRPNLAHRIDRLTSGIVLVGKSAAGLRGLTRALRRKKMTKAYLTLVVGEVSPAAGFIDAPILRRDLYESDRLRVEIDRDGKPARTLYRVIVAHGGLTLAEAQPQTGRTHQIRAHFAHVGCPVAGDPIYGDEATNRRLKGRHGLWRQWLHAFSVRLNHPVTGATIHVTAPLPKDLTKVLTGEGFPTEGLPEGATER
ncbi:MAG: RluA family pseudouridine synthase [Planctomycetota bacterium]